MTLEQDQVRSCKKDILIVEQLLIVENLFRSIKKFFLKVPYKSPVLNGTNQAYLVYNQTFPNVHFNFIYKSSLNFVCIGICNKSQANPLTQCFNVTTFPRPTLPTSYRNKLKKKRHLFCFKSMIVLDH